MHDNQFFHQGLVAPLDKNNVDTDQIIPKQFLTSVSRDGFDAALFYDWRYRADGSLNPEFVLNESQYQGASILLARDNFGCGSSREHAPWALKQYGFSVIIAKSFADIFFNNCVNNQMLAITVDDTALDALFARATAPGFQLHIDLAGQKLLTDDGQHYTFAIASDIKQRLLAGLDFIGVTLCHDEAISSYEAARAQQHPWW